MPGRVDRPAADEPCHKHQHPPASHVDPFVPYPRIPSGHFFVFGGISILATFLAFDTATAMFKFVSFKYTGHMIARSTDDGKTWKH
jgi:hypothetical protein